MKKGFFQHILTAFYAVLPVVGLLVLTAVFGCYGAVFGAVIIGFWISDSATEPETTEPETTEPNQE